MAQEDNPLRCGWNEVSQKPNDRLAAWPARIVLASVLLLPGLSPAEEKDLFVTTSAAASQVAALDDVLGKTPKTVFIPGRFYRNGQGALFIEGQRFSTTSGARDVAGFLSASGTYLIAVRANVVDFVNQRAKLTRKPG